MTDDRRPLPPLATTGIGSLPHTQLELGLQLALAVDMPYLPSLPMKDPAEFMIPQALEALPGLAFDRDGTSAVRLGEWKQGAAAFGGRLNGALETGRVGELEPTAAFSSAWSPFLWEVEHRKLAFAKVQITGPVTGRWALRLEDGRSVCDEPELDQQIFRLVLGRAMAMARAVRERGATPVVFFDEPGLCAIDPSRNPTHAVQLKELALAAAAVRKEGAWVGVHCCGNTDWGRLFGLGLDVLSLDARLSLGAVLADGPALARFLDGGGWLALGIVPTNVASSYDLEGLVSAARAMIDAHAGAGPGAARILARSLLTPACGLALRSVQDSERTFEDLARAQGLLRRPAAAG